MSFFLCGLSPEFTLKEATHCAIVAGILGHLAFFLHKESPHEKTSLERAAQIYKQSKTCDTSVKQAVERIFQLEDLYEGSCFNQPSLNPFKKYINYDLLVREAIQVALDNLILTNQPDALLPHIT